MKIARIQKVEYYFVRSENNHLYRKSVNETQWEWLKKDGWVKVDDNESIETAFNEQKINFL